MVVGYVRKTKTQQKHKKNHKHKQRNKNIPNAATLLGVSPGPAGPIDGLNDVGTVLA